MFDRVVSSGFLPIKFTANKKPGLIQLFWQTMYARLNIDHRKTVAFHVQTNGAVERLNQTHEMAPRAYIASRQND